MLVNLLINTVSLGGNLLMNVGPTARGYFDHRAEQALDTYAAWMKYNSRSIYGCTMAEPEFVAPEGCRLTQSEDGKRLYIHLLTYPFGQVTVENLADKIEYAQFLHDASEVLYRKHTYIPEANGDGAQPQGKNAVFFNLPTVKPHTLVPVIEVFLK